jgi:hypothetical protein
MTPRTGQLRQVRLDILPGGLHCTVHMTERKEWLGHDSKDRTARQCLEKIFKQSFLEI